MKIYFKHTVKKWGESPPSAVFTMYLSSSLHILDKKMIMVVIRPITKIGEMNPVFSNLRVVLTLRYCRQILLKPEQTKVFAQI